MIFIESRKVLSRDCSEWNNQRVAGAGHWVVKADYNNDELSWSEVFHFVITITTFIIY